MCGLSINRSVKVFDHCTIGLTQVSKPDSMAQPTCPSHVAATKTKHVLLFSLLFCCCRCSRNLFSQWTVLLENQVSDAQCITRGSIQRGSLRVLTFQVNPNSNIAACLIRFGASFFSFFFKKKLHAIVTIALFKLRGVDDGWMDLPEIPYRCFIVFKETKKRRFFCGKLAANGQFGSCCNTTSFKHYHTSFGC